VRVVHALDHSLPELSGYAVRSHALLRAQRAAGIDARALAFSTWVRRPEEATLDGVRYRRLPLRARAGGIGAWSAAARMLAMTRALDDEVGRHGAAILHAHSPSLNGLAALLVARRRRLPLVYEMRALWEAAAVERGRGRDGDARTRAARRLETALMRRVAALVVISHGLREEAMRRGVASERIRVVANGVDATALRPRPPDAELARRLGLEGCVVFGYLGFFHAYEGVDLLLRAFAPLAAEREDVRLLLVGEGEREAALRALAAELGIGARVVFAGSVPHGEVQRWYSLCDVVVYPRRASRLTDLVTPLKPLEALAMARPVVAAGVGGLRELLACEDARLLVPPGDETALAAALRALASSPERRRAMGERGRRWVAAERDWSRLGREYGELYARVARGRR